MIPIYSDQLVLTGKKSIFLAGPTRRQGDPIPTWRIDAKAYLEQLGFDGVVFIPEYSSFKPIDYEKQAHWEWEALETATVIAFWIPRSLFDMMGLTTNVEFGMWVKSGKALYGRPEESCKKRYLDLFYEEYMHQKPYTTLEELLESAVALAQLRHEAQKHTTTLEQIMELLFVNPDGFYQKVADELSPEEYQMIINRLIAQGEVDFKDSKRENSDLKSDTDWKNDTLVGRAKVLKIGW